MSQFRLHTLTIVAVLSFCAAKLAFAQMQQPAATLVSETYELVFLAVDGKDFQHWQTQISVSPGTHDVTAGVNISWKSPTGLKSRILPAPVKQSFKAGNKYSFRAKMLPSGELTIIVTDDTESERRPGS
jgi:hypothetical protein